MLDVLLEQNRGEEAEGVGREILKMIGESPLPLECMEEIGRITAVHATRMHEDWFLELADPAIANS